MLGEYREAEEGLRVPELDLAVQRARGDHAAVLAVVGDRNLLDARLLVQDEGLRAPLPHDQLA